MKMESAQRTETSWDPEVAYKKTMVAESYDSRRFSDVWGKWGDFKEKHAFRRAIREVLRVDPEVRQVVDVPCGTGRMIEELLQFGFQVAACDISEEMMAVARRKLGKWENRVAYHQANLIDLPFGDGMFDLISCVRLFGHFPSHRRTVMLREMARVTRRWVVAGYFYDHVMSRVKRHIKKNWLHTYPGVSHPVNEPCLRAEIEAANLQEAGRYWARRGYSEEVFLVLQRRD